MCILLYNWANKMMTMMMMNYNYDDRGADRGAISSTDAINGANESCNSSNSGKNIVKEKRTRLFYEIAYSILIHYRCKDSRPIQGTTV